MEKYSTEWKIRQSEQRGGWAQKHDDPDRHGNAWRWHYLRNDCEYVQPQHYRLKRECEAANQKGE